MKTAIITQIITKDEQRNEIRESLDSAWYDFAARYGIRIMPISYKQRPQEFDFGLLILSGGNSLNSVESSDSNHLRDVFEKSLLDYAIKNKIPVLAICRGMQVVNEYFGGTLKKVDGHVRVNHFIKINNLGLIVNSYHDYAVDKLGKGLKIDAVYEGVIEAVSSNDGLIKCIMWHPERTTHQDLYIETVV